MQVFPLHIGYTKVPYGQFYGGLSGWSGLKSYIKFATDKSHYILVPIYCYLVVHPTAGPLLIDTGISWDQANHHSDYYKGIAHYIFDDDEYVLDHEHELSAQLAAHGYGLEDIKTVFLTHLHEDHVGNLHALPNARIITSQAEWDGRFQKVFGFVPVIYQPSLPSTIETITYDTTHSLPGFPETFDLFGDGSVLILPTPGHTPGHSCVLVRVGAYKLLITGDCLYTYRHLANDDIQALGLGGKQLQANQNDSIKRMQQLISSDTSVVVAPEHDHTAYLSQHIVPALHNGTLSDDEVQKIRQHAQTLVTPSFHLQSGHFPHYVPSPTKDTAIGSVTE